MRDAVERGAGRHANDPFYQYLYAIFISFSLYCHWGHLAFTLPFPLPFGTFCCPFLSFCSIFCLFLAFFSPFLTFLCHFLPLFSLAIIYNRQGLYKEARALLISSLKSNAYNWSAWLELLHCCPSNDDLFDARVQLPDSLVSRLFLAHAFAHFFKAEEALAILDDHVVKDTFEKCRYVEGQRAVCLYNTRGTKTSFLMFFLYFYRGFIALL